MRKTTKICDRCGMEGEKIDLKQVPHCDFFELPPGYEFCISCFNSVKVAIHPYHKCQHGTTS